VPRVTAAITTYNRAGYVAGAVASVLGQTYRDYEILVIDDGSTDDTAEALRPFEGRIRFHEQENQGRAAARNSALRLATGEYIAFLDSDDLWLPDKLTREVRALDARPSVGMVHGHVEMIDDAGEPLAKETGAHRAAFEHAHRNGASYEGYALDCVCLTSTAMFRAAALEQVGGYDTGFEALEDLDLYLRLLLDSEIAVIGGTPLSRYRLHGEQTSSTASTLAEIQVCHKHLALLDAVTIPNPRTARRNFYLRLVACHHRLGQGVEVRRWARRALMLDPTVVLQPHLARQLTLSLVPAHIRGAARR
jgi:glycosyltransferase involved in cell wall biosynthesis